MLGKRLNLFHFHPSAPRAVFWMPRGTVLYNTLLGFERALQRRDFLEVKTPLMYNKALWETPDLVHAPDRHDAAEGPLRWLARDLVRRPRAAARESEPRKEAREEGFDGPSRSRGVVACHRTFPRERLGSHRPTRSL